jgi:hypothetical protein
MKLKLTILGLILSLGLSVKAQTATVIGLSVPQYMASGTSTRLPVLAKAFIVGLMPNQQYQYIIRGYSSADLTSTSLIAGAGNPLYVKNDGKTKYFAGSVSFSNGLSQDTFSTGPGGEYSGWFGLVQTGNSRFNNGNAVYIGLTLIAPGLDTQRLYISDSITALAYGSGTSNGTGIWGASKGSASQMVSLYDEVNPTGRPLSNALIENFKSPITSVVGYYSTNVEGKNGNWGAIIPNNLANGVRNISRFDLTNDGAIYQNTDSDGIWGADSITTINPTGGTSAIQLGLNEAALVAPEIEFLTTTSNTSENESTHKIYVRRRYSNNSNQSVRIRVAGNTATNGVDYNQINPFRVTFKPGKEALDSFTITIIDDNNVEAPEDIVLTMDSATNAVLGTQRTHITTIADNDIAYLRVLDRYVVVEEDAIRADIRVAITRPINTPNSVRLEVMNKPSHSFIPNEFKVSATRNNDTTFTVGNATKPDTVTISTYVYEETIGDLNDTINLRITQLTGSAVLSDSFVTVVIVDNDGPSLVGFVGATSTVSEKADSIELKVAVLSRKGSLSDFAVVNLSDVSTATQGLDFTYPTARIFSLTPSSPDTIVFRIALKDDNIYEGTEKAVFGFSNLNKTTFSSNDTFTVTIIDNELPYYPIGTVRKQNVTTGVADSLNVRCQISGTVYGINLRTSGLGFTIRDNTGGMGVFSPSATYGYMVTEGDSVLLQGRISQFAGTVQMDFLDTVIVLKKNTTLQAPKVVARVTEATESDLVKFNTVKLVNPSQWPSTALAPNAFANVIVEHTNGTYDTLNIDSETNIDGTTAPVGYFNVTGLAYQLDFSNPFTTRYMLTPRRLSDFEAASLPSIRFTKTSDSTLESAGTYTINLSVSNATESFTADVFIKSATALSPGDYTYTTQKVNAIKGTTSYTVTLTLADDILQDGKKEITFALRNIVGPGSRGADSLFTLTIKDDEPSINTRSLEAAGIKMYPVPSQNVININSPILIKQVILRNTNGQVVMTKTINSKTLEANIANLSSGIYHVQVMLDGGQLFTGKLIKE